MTEYHKIQTVFLRDPATKMRTLLDGQWALPEFEYLARNPWYFTEKIDGINIRVVFDGESVSFGGRTPRCRRSYWRDCSHCLRSTAYGPHYQPPC